MTKIWDKVKSFFNPVLSNSEKIERMKSDRFFLLIITWCFTVGAIAMVIFLTAPVECVGEIELSGDILGNINFDNHDFFNVSSTSFNEINGTIIIKGNYRVPYHMVKEIMKFNEDW